MINHDLENEVGGKLGNDDGLTTTEEEIPSDSSSQQPEDVEASLDRVSQPLGSRKALWGYMILCFSTGPTSSMVYNYVTAAIQSAANHLGHELGSANPCARRGSIQCMVKFGTGEIDYLSYVLYLRAIARVTEGVMTIIVSGIADYSAYRKTMMITSIVTFGVLALPFAGLTQQDYGSLTALSALYVLLSTVSGVYTVIEASYIPMFMRSRGWFGQNDRQGLLDDQSSDQVRLVDEESKRVWTKGVQVSVLGLVSSNIGGILALLIGVIITYSKGAATQIGYFNYLLAITISGCLTIVFGSLGQFLLPSIDGVPRPKDQIIWLIPVRGWLRLIKSLRRYPEAFKLCLGWILWNTGSTNLLALLQALFLEVSGINHGSSVFTVWSFTSIIFACLGSLGFMFIYPLIKVPVKVPAYIFLFVQLLCALWGCIGIINSVPVGYKHAVEFWVQQVLFMSTQSALRCYNRTMYSSLLPKGSEAQFFGLELTLDLAVGWINPLVQGIIQSKTHNLRFPMLPNLVLIIIAILLYFWVDISKGIRDAKIPLAAYGKR